MMCFTGLFQKKINIIVKLHFNLTFDFVITEAVKLTINYTTTAITTYYNNLESFFLLVLL